MSKENVEPKFTVEAFKLHLDLKLQTPVKGLWLEPVTNRLTGRKAWAVAKENQYLTDDFRWIWWAGRQTTNWEEKPGADTVFLSLPEAKEHALKYANLYFRLHARPNKEESEKTIELLAEHGYVKSGACRHSSPFVECPNAPLNERWLPHTIRVWKVFQEIFLGLSDLPTVCKGAKLSFDGQAGGAAGELGRNSYSLTIKCSSAEEAADVSNFVRATLQPYKELLLFADNSKLVTMPISIVSYDTNGNYHYRETFRPHQL